DLVTLLVTPRPERERGERPCPRTLPALALGSRRHGAQFLWIAVVASAISEATARARTRSHATRNPRSSSLSNVGHPRRRAPRAVHLSTHARHPLRLHRRRQPRLPRSANVAGVAPRPRLGQGRRQLRPPRPV